MRYSPILMHEAGACQCSHVIACLCIVMHRDSRRLQHTHVLQYHSERHASGQGLRRGLVQLGGVRA